MSNTIESLALTIGLVAIGAAMAWAVALAILQDASIAAGVLPQPGERTPISLYKSSPLWNAATTLQTLANVSGVIGALLLMAFGYWNRREIS